MKTNSALKVLTSMLILAWSAELALHAQNTEPYQGFVGRIARKKRSHA
jgi:hypothetical protein